MRHVEDDVTAVLSGVAITTSYIDGIVEKQLLILKAVQVESTARSAQL